MSMDEAFQKAFQTTFENMEKALRDYIKNDRYPIVSGQFEHKVQFDKEMQAATISDGAVFTWPA